MVRVGRKAGPVEAGGPSTNAERGCRARRRALPRDPGEDLVGNKPQERSSRETAGGDQAEPPKPEQRHGWRAQKRKQLPSRQRSGLGPSGVDKRSRRLVSEDVEGDKNLVRGASTDGADFETATDGVAGRKA